MSLKPIFARSPFPINMGFETHHRSYFTTTRERVVFNALRIMSYIPIISLVGVLIKLRYEKNWRPRWQELNKNFDAECKSSQAEINAKRVTKLTREDLNALIKRVRSNLETMQRLEEIARLHTSHRIRAIVETIGLGIVYMPMDLYHTAYRAIPIAT